MIGKRGLLFAGAAAGAIVALVGVGIVIWAWFYPASLVETLGATATTDRLIEAHRMQLHGTLGGLLAAVVGLGVMVRCFIALERDLNRLQAESGISRGRRGT